MKSTKAEADYQTAPRGRERCAGCSMFVKPDGCTSVSGDISPDGWCRFYEAKVKAVATALMK